MGRLLGELVHKERRNYHGSAEIDYCSPGNPHAILSLTGFVSAFFDQAPPIARQARPEVPAESGNRATSRASKFSNLEASAAATSSVLCAVWQLEAVRPPFYQASANCFFEYQIQTRLGSRPGNPQFPFPRFPIWPGIGEGRFPRFPIRPESGIGKSPVSRFGREPGIGVPIRRAGDFLVCSEGRLSCNEAKQTGTRRACIEEHPTARLG
jgi:hypothetical protein